MPRSRLTSKYQATVPAEVRRALGLKKGDLVEFKIRGRKVTLERAEPVDRDELRSLDLLFSEWGSPYDDEAYAGL